MARFVAIPQDEFAAMQARARSYRKRADELGAVSGPVIVGNVHNRLARRPTETLPPAQSELVNEIFALLDDSRLSVEQTKRVWEEFFRR